jgi:hypothetical protein
MVAIATPYDKALAELNVEIGRTIVAYGTPAAQAAVRAKQDAIELSSFAVTADRLAYNAKSGGKVVQGSGELIDAMKERKIGFSDIQQEQLPKELQGLSETELRAQLDAKIAKRTELQAKIQDLGQKREAFIAAEQKRLAATGRGDGFDSKVAEILREQAKRKGISY